MRDPGPSWPSYIRVDRVDQRSDCIFSRSIDPVFNICVLQKEMRGGAEPSELDKVSCMVNKAPGSPSLSILSFSNAFHGRTIGKHTQCHNCVM